MQSEADLASELLEVASDQELEEFFGKLVKGAGKLLKSPLGKVMKGIAKKALPLAGSVVGNMVVPGLGGAIGGGLANAAGSALGLEAEGLPMEQVELETAKRVVRVAKQATRQLAANPAKAAADPRAAIKTSVAGALKRNLPGLVTGAVEDGKDPAAGALRTGRWIRRGSKIVLYGV
jgi:hypothetical protein